MNFILLKVSAVVSHEYLYTVYDLIISGFMLTHKKEN